MFFSLNVRYFNFPVNPFLKGCFTFGVCIQKTRQDMEQTKFSAILFVAALLIKFFMLHTYITGKVENLHTM